MGKKNFSYNQAQNELSLILENLESERIDVDELSSKVKRAVELIRICRERIEKTELQVKEIVNNFQKNEK
ncbi:MAG: exodeoxyribonuclease VII small subunit [Candidatus Omnitrophota bacterium]